MCRLPINMPTRNLSVLLIPRCSETIGGARSPITTKKAIHVPPKNPIMKTSIAILPAAPNTLKAETET